MRVDLRLQERELHVAQAGLLLRAVLEELIERGDHLLEALAERLELRVADHERLTRAQIAAADLVHTAAERVDRLREAPADMDDAPPEHEHQDRRPEQDRAKLKPELVAQLRLHLCHLPGLIIEIGVQVLLDEAGEHIDVGFQLRDARVVARRGLDLVQAAFQVLAEAQDAIDGLEALAVFRALLQRLRQLERRVDLADRQTLGIGAADHIIIHFQVHIVLEVLVEAGDLGDGPGNGGIL